MTRVETPQRGNRRGLNEAAELCLKHWIPVSEGMLRQVQQNLRNGTYNENRDALVEEILEDNGLFFHCIRQLARTPDVQLPITHPIRTLKNIPLEDLSEMLFVEAQDISPHYEADASRIHLSRVKHSIISCETARYVAESKTIDPSLTIVVALLRQMGHHLLAWNFQRTYTKALDAQSTTMSSLESYLQTILGFSPEELSRVLAHRLQLDHNLIVISGDLPDGMTGLMLSSNQNTLFSQIREICRIGEAFARVSDREFYPQSMVEFAPVWSKLEKLIGRDGITELTSRVHSRVSRHPDMVVLQEIIPEELQDLDYFRRSRSLFVRQRVQQNIHLAKTPSGVASLLTQVYEELSFEGISIRALNTLILEVLPVLGFEDGCVYFLDARGRRLVPKLRLGRTRLSSHNVISYSETTLFTDPIGRALHSNHVEQHPTLLGSVTTPVRFSCRLESEETQGVVSLLLKQHRIDRSAHEFAIIVRAVTKCLEHCLDLR